MHDLDDQERLILRALIRSPRAPENRIARETGVPVRSVRRKRQRLEERGVLKYYAAIDREGSPGSGCTTQHII